MPFQYTSPPLTKGLSARESATNLMQWLDTLLLLPGTQIARARHQDGSFTNIYERIPENKFPEVINCLVTAPLNVLFTACKTANISAGKCYSINASGGMVKTYHFCVGPFTSNT